MAKENSATEIRKRSDSACANSSGVLKKEMAGEMDLAKFDDAFLGILQHLGKIEPFLDAIFFFLARRTDFFKLMHNRDDKMGFPPGVAEQIVLKIFKKYQDMVLSCDAKQEKVAVSADRQKRSQTKDPICNTEQDTDVPEAIQTVEIETDKPTKIRPNKSELGKEDRMKNRDAECTNTKQEAKNSPSDKAHAKPKSDKETHPEMTDPDSYNGAVTDKYSWSQTATDVDVKIPLPHFVKKSKDINVIIMQDRLKVSLKNDPPPDSGIDSKVLLEGKFSHRVKCEDCLWSVVLGDSIQISLEKTKDIYWTALLEGEKEIDRTKLDTTRNIEEFDDQTQADFQKVMYDHHQKLQGKPTSEEQKTHDLLKQAWDAEGSPFKGTPFDPSRVNISSGNG